MTDERENFKRLAVLVAGRLGGGGHHDDLEVRYRCTLQPVSKSRERWRERLPHV